mmetsp:Transcript_18510/g.35132  ORF Transcript_18510/g.35132 Transcript_18510/m.35132 type:complete len:183 (-) Transcript_18510:22-570(-)
MSYGDTSNSLEPSHNKLMQFNDSLIFVKDILCDENNRCAITALMIASNNRKQHFIIASHQKHFLLQSRSVPYHRSIYLKNLRPHFCHTLSLHKLFPHLIDILQNLNFQLCHLQNIEKVHMQDHPLFGGMSIERLVFVRRIVQKAFSRFPMASFGSDPDMGRGNRFPVFVYDFGGYIDAHLTC